MDEETRMMRDNLLICACFWLAILSLVFLSACTPTATVEHTAPQLDAASDSIRKTSDSIRKIVVEGCAQKACPTLAMPPIPQECVIDIRGDSMTASSKECEDLVRFYVRARQLLKPAAPGITTP